jgi:pyruvate,water dikinase
MNTQTETSEVKSNSIRWLTELDQASLAEAGGKGANLGEMTRAGLPVPPGFVVTASAYRSLLEAKARWRNSSPRLRTWTTGSSRVTAPARRFPNGSKELPFPHPSARRSARPMQR